MAKIAWHKSGQNVGRVKPMEYRAATAFEFPTIEMGRRQRQRPLLVQEGAKGVSKTWQRMCHYVVVTVSPHHRCASKIGYDRSLAVMVHTVEFPSQIGT